jgi:hypothetical protein
VNTTSRDYPAGDLRASDADRDAALSELSEHFQAGRLTSAEFDERTSKALSAQTGRQLAELMADLPDASVARPGAVPASQAGARPARRRSPAMAAIILAIIGSVVAITAVSGHVRGGIFPWWLIPLGFLVLRRLTCSSRGRTGSDSLPPGSS